MSNRDWPGGSDPEAERLKQFSDLRRKVHEECERDSAKRIQENPAPTEQEVMIGAFTEEIESQVREALLTLNQKGYPTESSGFGGENGEVQAIDGYFEIDPVTRLKLEEAGVMVVTDAEKGWHRKGYTSIFFNPEAADLGAIAGKWKEIADLLPALGAPQPSISGGSEEFRKKYGSAYPRIELAALERRIRLVGEDDIEPSVLAEIKNRIKSLKSAS